MAKNYVIFTQRAFNSIVTEVIDKHPIETGGILIGYVLDNGAWIVVENIPPGYHTVHQRAYFEYDAEFVNYLSNVVALHYKGNLQVLGLWHRHPGSMDSFSRTDDGTNIKFARDRECGAISALVNCDPQMRMTMYHVSPRGRYETIDWYVDDGETIPEEFLELRFKDEESLPFFDEKGVIRTASINEVPFDNEEIAGPEEREVQDLSAAPEAPEAAVESPGETYTLQHAFADFREIVRKLIANKQ